MKFIIFILISILFVNSKRDINTNLNTRKLIPIRKYKHKFQNIYFDFEKINGYCHRLDKKCMKVNGNIYYLYFRNKLLGYIHTGKNNEFCSSIYGYTLTFSDYSQMNLCVKGYENYYKVNTQTLNILNSCTKRTIFFKHPNGSNLESNLNISIEVLEGRNKFITFFAKNLYSWQIVPSLNGLIRTRSYKNANIIFSYKEYLRKKNSTELNKIKLKDFQKAYYIPAIREICDKDRSSLTYREMRNKFPNDYNYMPETYVYPEDAEQIKKKFQNYTPKLNDLWIYKPSLKSGGKDIHVIQKFEDIIWEDRFIIQKYIENPHLYNGKKYDLRLFLLIGGLRPLRLYFYREGLVRINTQNFTLDFKELSNKHVHVSNIKQNRDNPNFKFIESEDKAEEGFFQRTKDIEKYLYSKLNISIDEIRKKIIDLSIKHVISGLSKMRKIQDQYENTDQNIFELTGVDIVLTENLEPKLTELNYNPQPLLLDKFTSEVTYNVVTDSLNLAGLKFTRLESSGEYTIKDAVNDALCEFERPKGGFDRIFPLKSNINVYKKYFDEISEEDKSLWSELLK